MGIAICYLSDQTNWEEEVWKSALQGLCSIIQVNNKNNSLGIQCNSSSLIEQFFNIKGVFRHEMRRELIYQEIKGSRLTKTKKN